MESHPQNPEFRNNPENFHPCNCKISAGSSLSSVKMINSLPLLPGNCGEVDRRTARAHRKDVSTRGRSEPESIIRDKSITGRHHVDLSN